MLPNKIRIGCYDYEVIETDKPLIVNGRECSGRINYETHTIEISIKGEKSEQSKEQTLWHEIVHGIFNYRNFDPVESKNLESIVEEIALGVYGICKNNGPLPGQKSGGD